MMTKLDADDVTSCSMESRILSLASYSAASARKGSLNESSKKENKGSVIVIFIFFAVCACGVYKLVNCSR
jgi:hypothetical protein